MQVRNQQVVEEPQPQFNPMPHEHTGAQTADVEVEVLSGMEGSFQNCSEQLFQQQQQKCAVPYCQSQGTYYFPVDAANTYCQMHMADGMIAFP